MFAKGRIGIRVLVPAAVALLATHGFPGSATAADQRAALGGGSGIVLGGQSACTLTTIGFDRADRMVGLTAGHCAELGMSVTSEHVPQAGIIGTVASVDHHDDYAVIEFDRGKVHPTRQVTSTLIAGIGTPPREGDIVCKNGRTSGFNCGVVWDTHRWWFQNQVCSRPGDSGGPVTSGDRLVGMNVGHIGVKVLGVTVFDIMCQGTGVPVHDPSVASQIGMVLDDIDQSGGIGTGFRPL
ncbi:S1 family peptidase [Nocardia sp. NPDC057440]|uniref:S1 family peptidase n=1 Tax=Nocardia sp. NPDC057440 TaxID=3346134 RepID=UPI00366C975C